MLYGFTMHFALFVFFYWAILSSVAAVVVVAVDCMAKRRFVFKRSRSFSFFFFPVFCTTSASLSLLPWREKKKGKLGEIIAHEIWSELCTY